MENKTKSINGNTMRFKWLKRFGIAGFLFFFVKGLVWIAILVGVGKCAVQ